MHDSHGLAALAASKVPIAWVRVAKQIWADPMIRKWSAMFGSRGSSRMACCASGPPLHRATPDSPISRCQPEAAEVFQAAVTLDRNYARTSLNLGVAFMLLGRSEETITLRLPDRRTLRARAGIDAAIAASKSSRAGST
jgi:hypothetical protein